MFRKLKSQKGVDKQSGAAALEMAIVISILVILVLITAEFGRGFYYSNEFSKSVRDTTRFLSNNAITSANQMDITDVNRLNAKNLLIYGDVSGTGTTMFPGLTLENITITENEPYISVEAQWEYLTLFGSALPALGISSAENSFTLKAASTMRALE